MQRLILVLIILAMYGCGTLPSFDPVTTEPKTVVLLKDSAKTVSIPEGMVWYNNRKTQGIRFPAGIYALEAEDANYWYFRSPTPLEFRTFNSGSVIDSRDIPGGIVIGKSPLQIVPAGGYIEGETPTRKTLVWKLGGDFLRMQGEYWNKSF